jgi:hypothetical protein
MNRTRVLAAGAAGALLAVVATSFASPWWTLHRLQSAVAHHDAGAVSAKVDFPAMRESVKGQMLASLNNLTARTMGDNPAASMTSAMSMALINPLVDVIVSPTGVALMVEQGKIKTDRPAPPGVQAKAAPEQPRLAAGYRGWNRFDVTSRDGGSFIFRRAGLWDWKLAGLELPAGH